MLQFLLLVAHEDELFHSLLFGKRREPEEGRSYIVKERKPDGAMSHFVKMLGRGYSGLVISRQHPDNVHRKYKLDGVRLVWLSTTLGQDYIDPHNLSSITNLAGVFLNGNGKSVVLLDGIEYLTVHNDFGRVLKFMEYLNELVMQRQAILLISLDDRAFEPRQIALLERNATVLDAMS